MHSQTKIGILVCSLLIVPGPSKSQEFSTKFEYYTIAIQLGEGAFAAQKGYSVNTAYLNQLSNKGKEGYELVTIERYVEQLDGRNLFGITLTFKKSISEREKHLQKVIKEIDSIASFYAKKEISRAQADIMTWVNTSKASYTKEFIDQITTMLEAMLKEYFQKLKQDVLDTLNKK